MRAHSEQPQRSQPVNCCGGGGLKDEEATTLHMTDRRPGAVRCRRGVAHTDHSQAVLVMIRRRDVRPAAERVGSETRLDIEFEICTFQSLYEIVTYRIVVAADTDSSCSAIQYIAAVVTSSRCHPHGRVLGLCLMYVQKFTAVTHITSH